MLNIIYTILIILIVILCGDFFYTVIIKYRLKKWESKNKRDINGIRKRCQEFTLGNGKIALLMIHGFGDSPAVYKNFALALAQKNFTCRAMRLPYFAEPISEYSKTNLQKWLDAVDNEIHQLKQNHNQVWIIARSLGGAISIRYLLENSKGADGLILLAPLIKVSNKNCPILSVRILYELGKNCLFFTKIFENFLSIDLYDTEAKKNHTILIDRFIPLIIYTELFKLIDSIKKRAKELKLPLLMILSQNDTVIDSKASEQFYQKISSNNKQLIILKNSGHVIPLDYEWKEVVSFILTFISQTKK